MKNVAEQFSNYSAFLFHFEPIIIEKIGRNDYIAYCKSDSSEHWIQRGTKEYINGWLYGSVQTVCGQIRKKVGAIKEADNTVSQLAELEYILEFAKERSFNGDAVEREQLRVLWTAYCLHHNIDCDTEMWGSHINQLWEAVIDGVDIGGSSDELHDLSTFDEYMCAYLT